MPLFKKKKEEVIRVPVEEEIEDDEVTQVKKQVGKTDAAPQIITEEQMIISQLNYLISAIDVINKKLDYIKAKSEEE